jgi:hypothetical protein
MKRIPWIVLSTAALVLILAWRPVGAGDKKSGALTDEQFAKFVQAEGKYLQDGLAKGKPDKKESRKLLAAAMLLEAYGLNSNHPDRASVTLHAAQLYDAFKAGDLDKAKSLTAAFYPKIQKSKDTPKDVKVHGEYGKLMVFFATDRIGGFGVEKELDDLTDQKDKFTPAQFDRLTELGHKMTSIAAVGNALPPKSAVGKKNWSGFVGDFGKAAQELATAAAAKNEAGTRQALDVLGRTCSKCHDVYRD